MDKLNNWNVKLLGSSGEEYRKGLENLLATCPLYGDFNCEIEIVPHAENDSSLFKLQAQGQKISLSCREKSGFFHALLCMAEYGTKTNSVEISRTDRFSGMQLMIDLSRNAVYTVSELKRTLCRLALLGFNACLLYMEDVYNIPGYPTFGYLRGRYSRKELQELDEFAQSLGIELIPCVQTLAHLRTALRWQAMEDVRDTADNLLVGEEKTYEFLDAMLKELSQTFKSRRVHLGMDEAMTLGHGKYLRTKGYRTSTQLMSEHITHISDIVKKYGLKPMLWDDMLFRSTGNGAYYGSSLNKELLESLPKGLEYVYWDYYHETTEHYDKEFEIRKDMNVLFAGGIWKWTGFAPNFEKTWATVQAATQACQKHGVKEVMAAAWADDSAETPLAAILPAIALYGEERFGRADNAVIDMHCKILSGVGLDDYFAIEQLELLPGYSGPNYETAVPSKQILYSDVLCGLFDWHYAKPEVQEHYATCEKRMKTAAQNAPANSEMQKIFLMYANLAKFAAEKAMLGANLRTAYKQGNKQELEQLCARLEPLAQLADNFREQIAEIWSASCKGQGLEVLDTRLGGVSARLKTAAMRINKYLNGSLEAVEELEEEILPYNGISEGRLPNTFYIDTVTANCLVYFGLF